jgi:hypothetical protein
LTGIVFFALGDSIAHTHPKTKRPYILDIEMLSGEKKRRVFYKVDSVELQLLPGSNRNKFSFNLVNAKKDVINLSAQTTTFLKDKNTFNYLKTSELVKMKYCREKIISLHLQYFKFGPVDRW